MRLISGPDGQPKGFGYVEFMDRESLMEAIDANGSELGNRIIRVDVSEQKDRPSRGFGDRSSEPSEADTGPWRRGENLPPAPAPAQSRERESFGRRDWDQTERLPSAPAPRG